ncbi:MAG: hypothetical protein ACRYG4_19575 [Janthinobacterium lividum]
MTYVLLVFAGALLCNCIPHLAAGLRGEAFPTPFGSPPGKGLSSPVINFVWGTANLLIGISLLPRLADADPQLGRLALLVGFLAIGISTSLHFGRVRASRHDEDRP